MFELAMRGSRGLDTRVTANLRTAMWTFERLSMRDKWRVMLDRAMDYWYWRGVRHQAGSAERVAAMRASARPPRAPFRELDLVAGLAALEALLDRERPAAVRVSVGGVLVGELPAVAGAERLRGVHLRPLLLKDMADGLVVAAARSGVLPPAFVACAAQTAPAAAVIQAAPRHTPVARHHQVGCERSAESPAQPG